MIGRTEEQRLLRELAGSEEAEFVVVYGRRRVGKTYLVRGTFGNSFTFSYTGIADVSAKEQRASFMDALREHGWRPDRPIRSWFDAFGELRAYLKARPAGEPIRVFIDEMPWMDNRKSDFVTAFEHFWNGWASGLRNMTLIVCGSATAWFTKKIFRSKGGLFNRVTRQIALKPFTLAECREYFESRGLVLNTHDMIESYMIFGGIPYYLKMLDRRYSLAINVDRLCFDEGAPLRDEFNRLFDTLFSKSQRHREVVEALSARQKGMTREALAERMSFADGGNLTTVLHELEESGFIRHYKPFGAKKRGALYQLIDPFTAFHLRYIRHIDSEGFWSSTIDDQRRRAWSGFAFERVCLLHVRQIRRALGIGGVVTTVSSWSSPGTGDRKGAQIDLVLERNDQVINLCEMKYSGNLYALDKRGAEGLRERADVFRRETGTRKAVHLTLVTTYGLKENRYSSAFQSTVTMNDLLA
jgi:AAA+ ATPase superfamily predicted ATPase